MARSPRQIVRTAVGIAALLPAIGLAVLAISLVRSGGFGGVLSGLLVAALAIGLAIVALLWTHAPVTIAKLLARDQQDEEPGDQGAGDQGDLGGPNGHTEGPTIVSDEATNGHGPS